MDLLIRNLVVFEHAAGDEAGRQRLNDAADDGTSWLINDESFSNALVAATS